MKAKKRLKKVGTVLFVVFLAVAVVLIYYTVREYRPDEMETIETVGDGMESLAM